MRKDVLKHNKAGPRYRLTTLHFSRQYRSQEGAGKSIG